MGKLVKKYQVGKVRIDVFQNKNRNGVKYYIFKLKVYTYGKPPAICLRRNNIEELQEILNQIEIKND